jgi:hypothetical protein
MPAARTTNRRPTLILVVIVLGLWPGDGNRVSGQRTAPVWYAAMADDGTITPFGVIVNGMLWTGWPDQNSQVDELPDLARIPAEWKPPGVELPRQWRAHRFDGRHQTLTTQRVVRGYIGDIGLATDLPDPVRPPDGIPGGYAIVGVATNGPDPIDVFRPVSKRLASQVLSRLEQDLFEGESGAIDVAKKSAEANGYVLKGPTPQVRRRAKIEVETLVAAVDHNRTTWVYLGGQKVYEPNTLDRLTVRLAAVVALPPRGSLDVRWTNLYVVMDGLYSADIPLAIVEVEGRTCWIVQQDFEDGRGYVLAVPAEKTVGELGTTCLPPAAAR